MPPGSYAKLLARLAALEKELSEVRQEKDVLSTTVRKLEADLGKGKKGQIATPSTPRPLNRTTSSTKKRSKAGDFFATKDDKLSFLPVVNVRRIRIPPDAAISGLWTVRISELGSDFESESPANAKGRYNQSIRSTRRGQPKRLPVRRLGTLYMGQEGQILDKYPLLSSQESVAEFRIHKIKVENESDREDINVNIKESVEEFDDCPFTTFSPDGWTIENDEDAEPDYECFPVEEVEPFNSETGRRKRSKSRKSYKGSEEEEDADEQDADFVMEEDNNSEDEDYDKSEEAVVVNRSRKGNKGSQLKVTKTGRRIKKTTDKRRVYRKSTRPRIKKKLTNMDEGIRPEPKTEFERGIVAFFDDLYLIGKFKKPRKPVPVLPPIFTNLERETFVSAFQKRVNRFAEEGMEADRMNQPRNQLEINKNRRILLVRCPPEQLKQRKQALKMSEHVPKDDTDNDDGEEGKSDSAEGNTEDRLLSKKTQVFTCEVCKKVLKTITNFRAHMMDHEGTKPHQCHICGNSYAIYKTLERHLTTHLERKVPCPDCDKMYKTKSDLNVHIRFAHTKDYKNQCSLCPKKFILKSGLTRHEKIHMGFKPHLCTLCGRGFPETRNLRMHLKSQHGETPNPYRVEVIGDLLSN